MDAQGVLLHAAVSLHAHPSSSKPLSTTQLRFSNPLLDLQKSFPTSPKTIGTTTTFPRIRAAVSRTKKEETVEVVRQQLENCYLIAGINYQGLTVKQFQELRRSLPESVRLLVAKNTLVRKAVEGTPWEALKPCMKGMNVWMFVHTEEIPGTLKQYRTFQKEKKIDANDYTGAVFEGKYYAPTEFKALETMPTRAEIYAKFLGALQGPSYSLVSTIQAPARDIVMILKVYVKKLEEEGSGQ